MPPSNGQLLYLLLPLVGPILVNGLAPVLETAKIPSWQLSEATHGVGVRGVTPGLAHSRAMVRDPQAMAASAEKNRQGRRLFFKNDDPRRGRPIGAKGRPMTMDSSMQRAGFAWSFLERFLPSLSWGNSQLRANAPPESLPQKPTMVGNQRGPSQDSIVVVNVFSKNS